ncbi:MAG: hypothetical protein C0595_13070 [Marinilabiliales bacterium]|nr:MAG: hypothetical protein C0595_13070 [Marinilabiliales bacterium]
MKRILLLSFVLLSLNLSSQIINIPADYPTIQEGIDASNDGDTVLVQPGTYEENIIYNGKSIVLTSNFIFDNDTNTINQTIIDGQWWDEAVQIINNEDSTTALIGFSITNGVRGVLISSANANILNCKVYNNIAPGDTGGGGIAINGYGEPGLDYNTVNVKNCDIYNNDCRHGGGISIANNHGVIENCNIYNNTCWENGNQIQFWNTETVVKNCYISEVQEGWYNVIEFRGGSKAMLINNIVISNNKEGTDAIFYSWEASSPVLINNTIINSSNEQGSLINILPPSHFTIYNSIIEGYTMNSGLGYLAEYCRLDNIPDDGVGNINAPTLLNNDYSLSDCSPCIGVGIQDFVFNEESYSAPVDDYLYNQRPNPGGSNPDMGAFENPLGTPLTPPTITTQPQGITICQGSSHTLTIEATGSPTLVYQWQKDNVDITDANSNTLILNNLTSSDEGNYKCLVSNSCEIVESNSVLVDVLISPDITQHPTNEIVYFTNDVQFNITSIGDEPLNYQWYGPSGLLSGATLSQLLIQNVTAADTGYYYCEVSNSCGQETSMSAHLTAFDQLIVNAGDDIGIPPGGTATLNGSYTGGSPNLTFHWEPVSLVDDPSILSPLTNALFNDQYFSLTVTDNILNYQGIDSVLVSIIVEDTLNMILPQNDTLYAYSDGSTRSDCGYVSGTNCDGDKIKAQFFTDEMKTFDIEKVLFRFGKAFNSGGADKMLKVGIWNAGGENNNPGDLLDFTTISFNQIVSDVEMGILSEANFSNVVQLPKSYYVGIFLPEDASDTLALKTDIDGASAVGVSWTLNSEDEWVSYSSDPRFFLKVSNAIFPVVKWNNLSIDEFNKVDSEYLVFPNPAKNIITVKAKNKTTDDIQIVEILDISGEIVKLSESKTVDISDLSSGLYIVKVYNGDKVEAHKLIISK